MDRMTMNDACDEIFNSRLPAYLLAPPARFVEMPCECVDCGIELDNGEDSRCEDCCGD